MVFHGQSIVRRVRVILVGAGRWGANHARTVGEAGGVLVGVVDVVREAAERLARLHGARAYTSIGEAVRRERPDAALIVVPPEHLYGAAREAMEHGLHVLVEKPVATRSRDALDLALYAEKRGLVGVAGYLLRFHPATRLLTRLAPRARPWLFEAHRLVHRRRGARSRPIDLDLASHDYDLVNHLFWRLRVEHARLEEGPGGSLHEAVLTGAVRARILVSDAVPSGVRHRVVTLYGEGVVATLDYDESIAVVKRRGRGSELVALTGEPPLTTEHRVFYTMVARVEGIGEDKHPLEGVAATLRDAVHVLELIEEARRLAKKQLSR